ncbi:hypothetical protein BX616_005451 [Lobosporangium transversale]|nr:hypothetical protein BX616_005451 [Lobosporangium transversale]
MGGYLTPDPAIEKWVRMRESTAKYFRWNGRNLRNVGILGLVIPAGLYYLASEYETKTRWSALGPSRKEKTDDVEDA